MPFIDIPMVLFYAAEATTASDITQQRLKLLKQSLSKTLTHFYPLAGRIKEAKASRTVFEFLNQPNRFSSHIHKLLPSQTSWEEAAEGHVAMVQVTCFPCGGIVIGTLVSHMIADGAAVSFFLNSWGATSRGAFHSALFPDFDAPFRFPQNDACPKDANLMVFFGPFLNKGRIAMRRFLFGAEAISKLKAQGSSLTVQNPSRVEAVSSLICKCAAKAFKENSGLDRPTLVTHAVNMRRRASPSFPDSCIGNFIWLATTLMMAKKEKVLGLPDLVIKTREAITAINSDFVKGFEGEGGYVRYAEVLRKMDETTSSGAITSAVNFVNCTSWCNFGLYGVDYGWGKPTWVSCTTKSPDVETVYVNSVLLMDTPLGNGIEAWIYLNEDDMTILEQDKDLLAFATLDPNPLQLNSYVSRA